MTTLKNNLTVLCILMGMISPVSAIATYKIDPSHSSITFQVKHLGLGMVKGEFKTFSGAIQYDKNANRVSQVDATVVAKSLDTGDEKRDKHLLSPDFLFSEKYANIYFSSMDIKRAPNGGSVNGTLTMRGVTKLIDIPYTFSGPVVDQFGNERIAVHATIPINRMAYRLLWNETLDNGVFIVDKTVYVELNIEATRETKPTPQELILDAAQEAPQ